MNRVLVSDIGLHRLKIEEKYATPGSCRQKCNCWKDSRIHRLVLSLFFINVCKFTKVNSSAGCSIDLDTCKSFPGGNSFKTSASWKDIEIIGSTSHGMPQKRWAELVRERVEERPRSLFVTSYLGLDDFIVSSWWEVLESRSLDILHTCFITISSVTPYFGYCE
jgi:hypothetical protein